MGCNCNSTPTQQVYVSPRVSVLMATNCDVTESQVISVKQSLLAAKTPQNAKFVNEKLGQIETMLNHGNYCLYNLNEMHI